MNQSTNEIQYSLRLFKRGTLFPADLFLDFENWREGSRGLNMGGDYPPQNQSDIFNGLNNITNTNYTNLIRSAHFSPFRYPSSTSSLFDIPSYLLERNQGLVLDRSLLKKQLYYQSALVSDLQGEIQFMTEKLETAIMDATMRSRKNVSSKVSTHYSIIQHLIFSVFFSTLFIV